MHGTRESIAMQQAAPATLETLKALVEYIDGDETCIYCGFEELHEAICPVGMAREAIEPTEIGL